ncbi:MAG TPA: hypothetical protein O0X39_05710 [Methanocorpusculum sp.]|nr:hypothetical protein [Methanocorpusculum sp.]
MVKASSEEIKAYLEMKEAAKIYGEPLTVNGVPWKKYAAEMEIALKKRGRD